MNYFEYVELVIEFVEKEYGLTDPYDLCYTMLLDNRINPDMSIETAAYRVAQAIKDLDNEDYYGEK
jgi:hypothetical protein